MHPRQHQMHHIETQNGQVSHQSAPKCDSNCCDYPIMGQSHLLEKLPIQEEYSFSPPKQPKELQNFRQGFQSIFPEIDSHEWSLFPKDFDRQSMGGYRGFTLGPPNEKKTTETQVSPLPILSSQKKKLRLEWSRLADRGDEPSLSTFHSSIEMGSLTELKKKKTKARKHPFEKIKKNEGCTCKKSRCLKNYCPCFSNQNKCGSSCMCEDCSNGRQKIEKPSEPLEENQKEDELDIGQYLVSSNYEEAQMPLNMQFVAPDFQFWHSPY